MDITTANTTDGVAIIAKDGRIGDRRDDYTRLTLTPEAVALVMGWVPHVHSGDVPRLIRKAHKGQLAARVATERAEALMARNQQRRCEDIAVALMYHRDPRSWGF